MHVLIAVNESLSSHYAFEWCLANLISRASASAPSSPSGPEVTKVTLITIIEPPAQASYYYAASGAVYTASFIDEVYQKATEAATAVVRNFQHALASHNAKLPVEMVVGRGDVRDEIVDYASAAKVDLVVLGSRGLGALKRTFVGSTSDYAVHHCRCPVLVIKRPEDEPSKSA